jgi:hypothetical protein
MFTAYVKVNAYATATADGLADGWTQISFDVDRDDPRNADWWRPDEPLLNLTMIAQTDAIGLFEFGKTYGLTFTEEA